MLCLNCRVSLHHSEPYGWGEQLRPSPRPYLRKGERSVWWAPLWESQHTPSHFLTKCDTIKLNGVSTDAIWLRLLPFSVRDIARNWLQNEEWNAFATWDALYKAFLSKYFLPEKTAKLRADITLFTQLNGNHCMRLERGLEVFNTSVPINECPTGSLFRHSTMDWTGL